MAIQVSLDGSKNRILETFSKSYAVIHKTNSSETNIRVDVVYYASKTARQRHKDMLNNQTNNMPPMDKNPFIHQKSYTFNMSDIDALEFDKTDMSITDILKKACYIKLMQEDDFVNGIEV